MSGREVKERLLDAAVELFYNKGIQNVGVEAVADHADVHKMALYRQFRCKEDLIISYLLRMEDLFWVELEKSIAARPNDPSGQMVQIVTDLCARASQNDYAGCPFLNASIEFQRSNHPVRLQVASVRSRLLDRLRACADAAGIAPAEEAAYGILLLMEGINAARKSFFTNVDFLTYAPRMAERMISGYPVTSLESR